MEIRRWEIHEKEIKIDFQSPLGEGAYASVYKVIITIFIREFSLIDESLG
jgi:hypothetical protein